MGSFFHHKGHKEIVSKSQEAGTSNTNNFVIFVFFVVQFLHPPGNEIPVTFLYRLTA